MKLVLTTAVAAAILAFTPGVGAMERVFAGSREARDVQLWLADEPRGDGIEAGGILWRPTIPAGLRYDDNIFANDARDHDDGIFSITPSLIGEGRIGAHEFGVYAYTRSDFGIDWDSQDNTEYGAGARLKLKVFEWLDVTGRYRYDRLAEAWDSPDVPLNAAERPEIEQNSIVAGLHPHFGRFFSDFEFMSLDVTYDDVAALGGGEIGQGNRNRDVVDILGALGYTLADDIHVYAQFSWNDHGYDDWPIDRDGGGKKAFVGTRFRIADRFLGHVYLGYVFQNFGDDDARLKEAEGFGFGAEFEWNLRPAIRLRLDALREIEEATTDLESGRFATTLLLRGAYRFNERLAIEGQFGYENDDYVGTPRDEDRFVVGLAGVGSFGRNLYSRLAYRYGTRDSDTPGRSYDRNEILLTVGWKH